MKWKEIFELLIKNKMPTANHVQSGGELLFERHYQQISLRSRPKRQIDERRHGIEAMAP